MKLLPTCHQISYFKATIYCTKFDFGWGSAPDPTGPLGELTALSRTPTWILGVLLLRETREEAKTGKEGEGTKRGKEGKEGRPLPPPFPIRYATSTGLPQVHTPHLPETASRSVQPFCTGSLTVVTNRYTATPRCAPSVAIGHIIMLCVRCHPATSRLVTDCDCVTDVDSVRCVSTAELAVQAG